MTHALIGTNWRNCKAALAGLGIIAILSGCGGGGGNRNKTLSAVTNPTARVGAGPCGAKPLKLNNYHNFSMPGDGRPGAKVFDDALKLAAQRDNVTFPENYFWRNVTADMIKNLNSSAKVYRFYDTCAKNDWDSDWSNSSNTSLLQTPVLKATIDANDWWLRDTNGEIIKENEHAWFIDVGKPGFKEEFLKNLLARNMNKGFDGFVLDYWFPSYTWFTGGKRAANYATDQDWFKKAWKPFIQYVCSGIHKAGYRVIGNCAGEYQSGNVEQDWQRTQVDGTVYEQGAVDWSGNWLPGTTVANRINHVNKDPLELWFANLGIKKTILDFDRKQLVALAFYYVSIPMDQQKRSYSIMYDRNPYWDPSWGLNIGTPASAEPTKVGSYFWSRRYTQGVVLLNYEVSKSVTFALDGTYHDAAGKKYSGKIQVPAHTGLILARGA